MAWSIVGRRFTPEEFGAYAAAQPLTAWKPQFAVLHNTAVPALSDRPQGFTPEHIHNLHGFYLGKGWSGCPHLFVDQNGIWVLNPLSRAGVHSPSWNAVSWGIEMLGDYNREAFHTGMGAQVRDNAMAALAVLCRVGGFPASVIRFHKEDPKTTHKTCPGSEVAKEWVISRVQEILSAQAVPQAKLVLYRRGLGDEPAAVIPIEIRNNTAYASRALLIEATDLPLEGAETVPVRDALKGHYSLKWVSETRRLYAVEL